MIINEEIKKIQYHRSKSEKQINWLFELVVILVDKFNKKSESTLIKINT